MSDFKFTEAERRGLHDLVLLADKIGTAVIFDYIEAIVNERDDQECAELRRQMEQLKEQNRKLNFMIDNGLGDRDMKNDI